MTSQIGLYLQRVLKSMWFRSTAFSLLAIVAALSSILFAPIVPTGFSASIGADSLDHILTIIASSMLTVTTFSLGIAVNAYYAAASAATPRATNLLVEDPTTQNVLATFVGAFLFSLVGIVVLRTGAYGEEGRVGLYFVTIGVIVVVVGTLLRWISHLTTIGRMHDTLARVENATRKAMDERLDNLFLSCTPLLDGHRLARGNHPVHANEIGYVQYIDTSALGEYAERWDMQIAISALPGTFVDPVREIVFVEKPLDDKKRHQLSSCFTIGLNRTFEQDPRFGVIVLSEIASRALSPAVNDPGTAIDVIGRLVRILHHWNNGVSHPLEPEVKHLKVFAPSLRMADLFDDAFTSISRDAAGIVEVNVRLQKAFATLAISGSADTKAQAIRHADQSLARAVTGLQLDDDLKLVRALRRDLAEKQV